MTPPDKPPTQPVDSLPPAAAGEKHSARAAFWARVEKFFDILASWGKFSAPPAQKKSPNDLAQDRTDLAVVRTLMAADRSLMAWVRTALAMISFGFTIYKILQGFESGGVKLGEAAQPRTVGLFLIGMGVLSIVMGTVEYMHRVKDLAVFGDIPIWRPSVVMATLISVLSVFLFVAVIFKAL